MFPQKNRTINKWAALLAFIFLLLFFIVAGRFIYLAEAKEVSGHQLMNVGKNQWTRITLVDAQRGQILDRNGDILAQDIPAYTVGAVLDSNAPSYVKDKEKTAEALAPIINMDKSKIMDLLNNKTAYQVELGPGGRKISIENKEKIEKMKLPGIVFIPESKRHYSNGKFASYALGFTTLDDKTQEQKGRLGIEQSLNKYLTEVDGKISFYSDGDNFKIQDTDKDIKKPKNGDNVYLTLDTKIQSVLDDAMTEVNKKYKPHRMVAVVANPKTGEILAMSNRPTFNPNKRDITNYQNGVVSDPYEPGSVMKTFTLAAAINEGVWNSNATFMSGQYKVKGSAPIHDWKTTWGRISFEQGFVRSSNVAFSIVEDKLLGPKKFYDYLDRFGLTKKTGIDLPGESSSVINFKWHPDQVRASFGQGSAFTAIQIVQAATAVANDGKMMKPYVIKKIVDPNTNKVVKKNTPKQVGTPITKKTAEQVRSLMREVVTDEENGTGTNYNIKNYDVIGKTGTSQLYDSSGKLLTGEDNYIFSFLGMAPEKDPQVIVYVVVDRPQLELGDTTSGSQPVSEVFNPVMQSALQYLKVEPKSDTISQDAIKKQVVKISDWQGKSIESAKNALEKQGLDVITVGNSGKVVTQSVTAGSTVFKGSKVILLGEGTKKMPDLTGWSLTDVLKLVNVLNIKPEISGNGYVINQKPSKNSVLKKNTKIEVNFKPIEGSDE